MKNQCGILSAVSQANHEYLALTTVAQRLKRSFYISYVTQIQSVLKPKEVREINRFKNQFLLLCHVV